MKIKYRFENFYRKIKSSEICYSLEINLSKRNGSAKRARVLAAQKRRRAQELELYLEEHAIDIQIEELEQIEHNLQYYDNE